MVVFLAFFLIRRRKLSKRMPSEIDYRGDQYDDGKLTEGNPVTTEGGGPSGEDVFAPFGGKPIHMTMISLYLSPG